MMSRAVLGDVEGEGVVGWLVPVAGGAVGVTGVAGGVGGVGVGTVTGRTTMLEEAMLVDPAASRHIMVRATVPAVVNVC